MAKKKRQWECDGCGRWHDMSMVICDHCGGRPVSHVARHEREVEERGWDVVRSSRQVIAGKLSMALEEDGQVAIVVNEKELSLLIDGLKLQGDRKEEARDLLEGLQELMKAF